MGGGDRVSQKGGGGHSEPGGGGGGGRRNAALAYFLYEVSLSLPAVSLLIRVPCMHQDNLDIFSHKS